MSLSPLFLGALIHVCAWKMVFELASDFIFERIILFFISEEDRSLWILYYSSRSRILLLMKIVESIESCELLSFKSLVATLMNLIALCSIGVGRLSTEVT